MDGGSLRTLAVCGNCRRRSKQDRKRVGPQNCTSTQQTGSSVRLHDACYSLLIASWGIEFRLSNTDSSVLHRKDGVSAGGIRQFDAE